jgi:hypothetical protein
MQLLVSYPFLHLYLHEGPSPAFEAQWRGFVSSSFLRQAITDALVLARQHRIRGWIADDRLLGPIRPADLEWIGTQVLPTLISIGVQRLARIEAADPMNKLLINKTQEDAQQAFPLEIRVFTDLQEARRWASE